MKAKNVTRVSLASRAARNHLRDAIRTASSLPAVREQNDAIKKQLLLGVRWTLRTLGVDRDCLLTKFVMQEFQDWVQEVEVKAPPVAAAPPRKQPQRIEPKHTARRRA
jgi:hypothetical protein